MSPGEIVSVVKRAQLEVPRTGLVRHPAQTRSEPSLTVSHRPRHPASDDGAARVHFNGTNISRYRVFGPILMPVISTYAICMLVTCIIAMQV